MSNVNLRPIQHSAVNYGRFGLVRYALAVVMAGVLFVASTGGFLYANLITQFANRVVNIDAYSIDGQTKATPDSFDGRAVNILVVGTDSRSGASGELGAGDEDEVPGLRNDSTMVIHVSADRSRVQIVSIPRDTLVDIPACKHRDGTISEPTSDDMFNNAMVYGANGGDAPEDVGPGIACVKSTVEKLADMTIDAFMVVDFAGFVRMIDALGGVWFNIPERIDDDSAQLYIDAGCWKLSGTHALAYMRSRKAQGDGSDISRIGRQQQLISAMLRELQAKDYVTDSGALLTFLQAAIQAVNVSPNLGDASADASLLINVLQKVDRSNIQFVTMPVEEPSWDPNRRIPSEPMARNVWNALKNDQALPVGTTFTDGNGAQLVVPDPTVATAPPAPTPSTTPSATPSATPTATANPSDGSNANPADNTEQSASVENNAANEAAAQQNAATCPPKDK
ncbi:LCP family protein [uncultured Actinomyces sp.]|uniref:LCP family protein n=1 Tax=uncultured Actinomyces sp. TaxID=249061 RepID=UPI00262A2F98|nr:LCP family protein [uncultured Actinomyces sp.]